MTLQLPRCESGPGSAASKDASARHPYRCNERAARVGQTVGAVYDGPGACDSRIDDSPLVIGVENLDLQPHGADEGIIKICS